MLSFFFFFRRGKRSRGRERRSPTAAEGKGKKLRALKTSRRRLLLVLLEPVTTTHAQGRCRCLLSCSRNWPERFESIKVRPRNPLPSPHPLLFRRRRRASAEKVKHRPQILSTPGQNPSQSLSLSLPSLCQVMLETLLAQATTTVGLQLLTSPALADATR